MEVSIRKTAKSTVLALQGSLELSNVGNLKKQVQPFLEDRSLRSLVIDLEHLDYMDSSGIALMAHIRKHMIKKNGRLRLLKTNEGVLQVMRLAALDQFFTFIDTEEDI